MAYGIEIVGTTADAVQVDGTGHVVSQESPAAAYDRLVSLAERAGATSDHARRLLTLTARAVHPGARVTGTPATGDASVRARRAGCGGDEVTRAGQEPAGASARAARTAGAQNLGLGATEDEERDSCRLHSGVSHC